jgi:hypothetical protein
MRIACAAELKGHANLFVINDCFSPRASLFLLTARAQELELCCY